MTKEKLSWLQQKMLNKSIKKKCQNFRELGYSSINEEDLLTYYSPIVGKNKPIYLSKTVVKTFRRLSQMNFLTINNYWHRHQKNL